MDEQRRDAATRNDLADVRSASIGATALGGHPSMLIGSYFAEQFPVVHSVQDATTFVDARVEEGADYIKLLIEDGIALGHKGPTLSEDTTRAIVHAAHSHGKIALAQEFYLPLISVGNHRHDVMASICEHLCAAEKFVYRINATLDP